jgi:arylsulfatase A-like enzyme
MDGIDLLELAADRLAPRKYIVSGFNNYAWYRDDRYVYIGRNDATHHQLFDAKADPLQQRDLSAEEPALVEELHRRVLAEPAAPARLPRRPQIDVSWYRVWRLNIEAEQWNTPPCSNVPLFHCSRNRALP